MMKKNAISVNIIIQQCLYWNFLFFIVFTINSTPLTCVYFFCFLFSTFLLLLRFVLSYFLFLFFCIDYVVANDGGVRFPFSNSIVVIDPLMCYVVVLIQFAKLKKAVWTFHVRHFHTLLMPSSTILFYC